MELEQKIEKPAEITIATSTVAERVSKILALFAPGPVQAPAKDASLLNMATSTRQMASPNTAACPGDSGQSDELHCQDELSHAQLGRAFSGVPSGVGPSRDGERSMPTAEENGPAEPFWVHLCLL